MSNIFNIIGRPRKLWLILLLLMISLSSAQVVIGPDSLMDGAGVARQGSPSASTQGAAPKAALAPPMPVMNVSMSMPAPAPPDPAPRYGPPGSNPWIVQDFSWICASPMEPTIDPVTQWECYSGLFFTFIAEANKCYQLECNNGQVYAGGEFVWKPIKSICPETVTQTRQVMVPVANCTWVQGTSNTTNLLATGYGTSYRVVSKY